MCYFEAGVRRCVCVIGKIIDSLSGQTDVILDLNLRRNHC